MTAGMGQQYIRMCHSTKKANTAGDRQRFCECVCGGNSHGGLYVSDVALMKAAKHQQSPGRTKALQPPAVT